MNTLAQNWNPNEENIRDFLKRAKFNSPEHPGAFEYLHVTFPNKNKIQFYKDGTDVIYKTSDSNPVNTPMIDAYLDSDYTINNAQQTAEILYNMPY